MTATKPLGLHRKLALIRGRLNGEIRKTGEHTAGGPKYKFVEALEVGRQFVDLASEYEITMVPAEMSILDIRLAQTKSEWLVFTVLVDWLITDSETGEILHVQSIGQGADASDKGAPKAQTNAMKYAILMLLQAAGDDPEKDEPEAPQRTRARRVAVRRNANREDALAAEPDKGFAGGADPEDEERPARRRPQRAEREFEAGPERPSADFLAKIRARQHEVGLTDPQMKLLGFNFTGKTTSKEWTVAEAEKVLRKLDSQAVVEEFGGAFPQED